jgi:hypothetical protein
VPAPPEGDAGQAIIDGRWTTEAWTLTCTRPDGAPTTPRRVEVARGATADVGEACATAAR